MPQLKQCDASTHLHRILRAAQEGVNPQALEVDGAVAAHGGANPQAIDEGVLVTIPMWFEPVW